jgi:prepilin-type N-terminal cleavage/methylation domain-containing protein
MAAQSRRPRRGGNESGFTLIELLVVLIIIGVIVTIAFPSYLGFQRLAERRTAQANLRALVPAVETYFADAGAYTGMSVASLKLIDSSLQNDGTNGVFVVSATGSSYCLRSRKGQAIYYKAGPDAAITTAVCT